MTFIVMIFLFLIISSFSVGTYNFGQFEAIKYSFFNFLIFRLFLASVCQNFVTAEARFSNVGRPYAWGDSFFVIIWSIISLPTFKSLST